MSCIKCGYLYCICDMGYKPKERLSRTEQLLLQMWEVWIDGRPQKDEEEDEEGMVIPDPDPRIILQFFRDSKVSFQLLELMARWAREYGHELG